MTDEQHEAILQDPSAHNVEDVIEALAGASEDELVRAKALENEGRKRQTILKYVPPALAGAGPSFETDEQFSLEGWQERAGWFEVDGRAASPHAIAGALHGAVAPGELLSQGKVQRLLERFARREAAA